MARYPNNANASSSKVQKVTRAASRATRLKTVPEVTDEENSDIEQEIAVDEREGPTTGRTSTFKKQKQTLYDAHRKTVKDISTSGIAQLEDALATFRSLQAKEAPVAGIIQDVESLLCHSQICLDELLAEYPDIGQKLSLRRSKQINSICEMLEANPIRRQQSLKTILRNARIQVETVRQNEKVATDASALIKHYKNLLRDH